MMVHTERLEVARSAVTFICSRSAEEMKMPVPNCPGWTVYNAAVHVGKVGIAWKSMIEASPDDPDSRTRGYAEADARGTDHDPAMLLEWALGPLSALDADIDTPCYFSMTGGHGTVGLWGRHAATELGIHRLDVEAALGHDHMLSGHAAMDAIEYTCDFFLPAMARVIDTEPKPLAIEVVDDGQLIGTTTLGKGTPASKVRGTYVDVLLALWGRPHSGVEVDGEATVLEQWRSLPSQTFQFGTWS